MSKTANFRFYGSLNDFLPKPLRHTAILYSFFGNPSVKDAIEALGVPHPEVNYVLVQGCSVKFDYHLCPGDEVEIYPAQTDKLRATGYLLQPPLPTLIRFILDVHLGKLARMLRLLGFDTIYQTDYDDKYIAQCAALENRIVLTRDVGLLKQKSVQWGYWLRSQHLQDQLVEVIFYFNLKEMLKPFTHCLVCNGILKAVPKADVLEQLPPKTRLFFQEFHQCQNCSRVFWPGSHYDRMLAFVQQWQ